MIFTTTGIDNLADILDHLHDLTKTQFMRLGLQLGLLVATLNKPTDDYGTHVLVAWLELKDNVII